MTTDDHKKGVKTMPIKIPQSLRKILEDKAYGHVVTFNADGKPELTMVWMDVEADELLFNTAEGRRKPANIRRNPRVIVSVQDRNNPQAYAVFHGKARITDAGADEQIDKLAKRFLGADKYPFRQPNEKRLIVRIAVDRISGMAPNFGAWS
jgi:PPOX class probable F420-dependent enzyme